eukprot:1959642-Amphidinium_carterae.2
MEQKVVHDNTDSNTETRLLTRRCNHSHDIVEQYFTKRRLDEKQPGHRLWVNNQSVNMPPTFHHKMALEWQ